MKISREEVTHVAHRAPKSVAPEGVAVCSPAFDVTPNDLVAAIVTEVGVARAPYAESLAEMRE